MATGQTIVQEVRRLIHDTDAGSYRWSDSELLDYLNAGLRQVVSLIPEARTVETVATISNNVARQTIPTDGAKFVRVSRNYSDDGSTPQGPVRYVEKDVLDSYDPDWEYDTSIKADGDNFFEHYSHDPREPTVYYVYPPCSASKKLGIVYVSSPAALSALSDTFPLRDEFINAAVQYVLYRALTKDSRDTMPSAFRQELWDNFLSALGLAREARKEISASAPQNRPPEGA